MMVIGMGISGAASAAGHEELPVVNAAPAEIRPITLPLSSTYEPQVKRPGVLPALYVTLGAVQAWDYYSTSSALKAGAREANPTTAAFVGNKGSLVGLKLATTASTMMRYVSRISGSNSLLHHAMRLP